MVGVRSPSSRAFWLVSVAAFLPLACEGRSGLDGEDLIPPLPIDGGFTSGGTPGGGGSAAGGTAASGGQVGTGGAGGFGDGGAFGTGGIASSGGSTASGGSAGAGGVATGGVVGAGGLAGTGGVVGSGGTGTGGVVGAGGVVGTGGVVGAGGFVPTCSSVTCSTGCCDSSGLCVSGRTDDACGTKGAACSDCASSQLHCAASGYCYSGAHCGPDNCAGCCLPNGQCRPGTTARACGIYGGVCDTCGTGETCQSGACAAPGATCPDPYGGCAPDSATLAPTRSTSCSAANLSALARACKGTTSSPACTTAAQSLARSNPACFTCVAQFFGAAGVTKCLAPFLTTTCNQSLTCATDCLDGTCGTCSSTGEAACQTSAFQTGGACYPYVSGYFCAQAAFGGQAAFCDFERIADIGLFLQGVGTYYCSN